jgi:DNA repair protein RecN (Recombination protein N)
MLSLAKGLTRARRSRGRRLQATVAGELEALGFPAGSFRVHLESRAITDDALELVASTGAESVGFRFAPNPGEGERPLHKIASGGELARVMLAIRSGLLGEGGASVLVFDEVDAAIGGAVLDAVATRLETLARARQVLCVTHEARIAARADHHLHLQKVERDRRTRTRVQVLDGVERQAELARMLGGEVPGKAARAHARELLVGREPT